MSEEEKDEQLGQDDIAARLAQDDEEDDITMTPESSPSRVEEYDFLEPSRFNRSELEKLKRISATLPQRSAQPLSRLLQSKVQMQLASTDQTMWQYMVEDFADNTVGYAFEAVPLDYPGLVTADGKFCSACLECLTGGKIEVEELEEITETDARVFSHIVRHLLDPLPDLWDELGEFSVELTEFVSDLESAAPFSPGEDMFQMCLLAEGEFGTGEMALCVPYELVRDLPQKMKDGDRAGKQTSSEVRESVKNKLSKVPVELSVELGCAQLPARRVLELRRGDALVLDNRKDQPLRVRVNNCPKMHGRPVLSHGNIAIKIEGDL